jgi:predicted ABC-type ATPase
VAVVQPAPGIAKPSALVNARTLAALESPVPASDSAGRAAYLHSAEIDRYLNAHRQYAQGSVLATPGGLRQVATSPADR